MKLMSKEMKVLYIGLTAVTLVLLVTTAGAAITGYGERGIQLRKLKVELAELQELQDNNTEEIAKQTATIGAYKIALRHARDESAYVANTLYNRRRLAQELYEVGLFEGRAWDSYLVVKGDVIHTVAKALKIPVGDVAVCMNEWVHEDLGFAGHRQLMVDWFMKIYTANEMQTYIRFCKSTAGKKHQIKQYMEVTMGVVFIERKGDSREAQLQLQRRLEAAARNK